MPGDDWLPLVLTAGFILILVVAGEMRSRRRTPVPDDPVLSPSPIGHTRSLAASLSALACTIAAIWLIPWAMSLPTDRPPALLPGILLVTLLSVSAIYALHDIGTSE